MSKSNGSREKIEKSIDGILGGLVIRGRSDKYVEELQLKLAAYEQIGTLSDMRREKDEIEQAISGLNQQLLQYQHQLQATVNEMKEGESVKAKLKGELDAINGDIQTAKREQQLLQKNIEDLTVQKEQLLTEVQEKLSSAGSYLLKEYTPPRIIHQYCEQSEGKRKLTIHLREIEYQAILKASHNRHTNKGQLMETITKALRFYIPKEYYKEAEKAVYQKALHSVRGFLEQLGIPTEELEKRTHDRGSKT